jgi:hypothetical protein
MFCISFVDTQVNGLPAGNKHNVKEFEPAVRYATTGPKDGRVTTSITIGQGTSLDSLHGNNPSHVHHSIGNNTVQ